MGSITPVNEKIAFPMQANTLEYARMLDSKDPLRSFRGRFLIPTKQSLKSAKLVKLDPNSEPSIYFCGNSLGVQPKTTKAYLEKYLDTWAAIGVHGHFTELEDSPLVQWQSLAEYAAKQSSRLVGALPSEVAVMSSLTVNLHLLMASFYKPTKERHKIILDWKAFPSDHYMFESQIRWHGYDPKESMILIGPEDVEKSSKYTITTSQILSIIDAHASETALILLPGIQYYTGQFFDMSTITSHAHSKGLTVGWDLAHAVGNVPLHLHDWDVDFAAWCNYKYMNAGPGAIGSLFVHEKHGKVDYSAGPDKPKFVDRLGGWYGADKISRFDMDNRYRPLPGAAGWQLSTTSVVDLSSLCASLAVFNDTSIEEIREKSLKLTGYLEHLLLSDIPATSTGDVFYSIITPSDPAARGAQLSVKIKVDLLSGVFKKMSDEGFVFDLRKPGVIRVAPTALYNTYEEVWTFVEVFKAALVEEAARRQ